MARLIRTEKEVEGRYTEQWVVVEGDDALDQWPQGPGEVVGRPAPRQDGHQRARGQAIVHGRPQAPRAAPRRGAALASRARARDEARPQPRARAARACSRAIGPEDCHVLQTEPPFHGAPVAAVAADSYERAREALALVEVEWEELEPLLDPEEAVRQESFVDEPRSYERGDVDAGFAEADVVVEAEYRTQTVLHNAMETHQSVCALGGRHARDLHLDPVHLGHPRRGLAGSSSCRPTACASSATTWAAASARRTGPATTRTSRSRSPARPAGRCAARSRGARRTSPPATATRRSSSCAPARAPTGRSSPSRPST